MKGNAMKSPPPLAALFAFFAISLSTILCSCHRDYTPSPKGMVISSVSQVKADMRMIAKALEDYYTDNNAYPPCSSDPAQSEHKQLPNELLVPSFRRANPHYLGGTLTTPVAYLPAYPRDRFADAFQTFGYYTDARTGWIIFSPGPDRKFDLGWEVYDSSISQPSPELISRYTYDPSNGVFSDGDIWRVKQ